MIFYVGKAAQKCRAFTDPDSQKPDIIQVSQQDFRA
jgi:hypothetical protein